MRCVGIILLAHFTNNEYGAGADHIVYGWGFNVAILLVLGVLGSLFRDEFREKTDVRASAAAPRRQQLAPVTALAGRAAQRRSRAVAWWHDNYFAPAGHDRDRTAVLQASGWQAGRRVRDPGIRNFPAPTPRRPARSLRRLAARPVDLYLGYYARPRPGHSMTAHLNQFWEDKVWTLADTSDVDGRMGGNDTSSSRNGSSTSRSERRMIWSTYWVNGRFTTSLFKVKLLQAAAALQGP